MKKLLLLTLVLVGSCRQPTYLEDGNGVAIKAPPIWHAPTRDKIDVGGIFVEGRVVYNNHRLFSARRDGQNYLTMRHVETGKILWEWNDFAQAQGDMPTQERVPLSSPQYQWNNILLIVDNWGNRYFIDLATGRTLSKGRFDIGSGGSSGIDDQYFLIENYKYPDGSTYEEQYVYTGKMLDNQTKLFFKPDYERKFSGANGGFGEVRKIKGFKSSMGDKYVAVFFIDPIHLRPDSPLDKRFKADAQYIALYNLSQERWVYRRKEVHRYGRITREPVVVGDKVYIAGNPFVACLNALTGKVLWKHDFYGKTSVVLQFYGLAVADGLALANSSYDPWQNSAILYAFDAESGAEVWRTKIGGSSSRLVTLNGVVYFIALGKLHAVEIATGKHLWRIVSPDLEHNSGAWFQTEITAVPGKGGERGIILTASYLSAMAFRAAR